MKTKTAYRSKPQAENEPQPEPELNSEPIIQAEPKSDTPALDHKSPAEKYAEETVKADEAATRLKQQLADLERSAELNRRQQQQIDKTNQQINQVFHFWKASGLTADQEQLLAANPALMIQLSGFAATEAGKLHQAGSPEYVEEGKKLFFQHLNHLQEQMRANQRTPEPSLDNHPTAEAAMPSIPPAPPGILDSIPPRPRQEARRSIVSAPVSRNGGPSGDYGSDMPMDPRKVRLSAEEREMARVSGITEAEYAKQKVRMMIAKQNGEIV